MCQYAKKLTRCRQLGTAIIAPLGQRVPGKLTVDPGEWWSPTWQATPAPALLREKRHQVGFAVSKVQKEVIREFRADDRSNDLLAAGQVLENVGMVHLQGFPQHAVKPRVDL